MPLTILLRVVAVIQIVLGLGYLFIPGTFLHAMGHSVPAPDLAYPLGMLAARFIAYGLGLWIASAEPTEHTIWIRLMAVIQGIDLAVGLYYSATGVVPWSLSGLPIFNAVWIGLSLGLLRLRRLEFQPGFRHDRRQWAAAPAPACWSRKTRRSPERRVPSRSIRAPGERPRPESSSMAASKSIPSTWQRIRHQVK